jgi:hypothetical protein
VFKADASKAAIHEADRIMCPDILVVVVVVVVEVVVAVVVVLVVVVVLLVVFVVFLVLSRHSCVALYML